MSPSDRSGRRQAALTREPGDLPSLWSRAGRGASATVESVSTVRESAAADFAPVPHPELKRQERRMSDIGSAGRATAMWCIPSPAATDPADAPDADAPRAGLALAQATAAPPPTPPDT